jgi:hypothetical protein
MASRPGASPIPIFLGLTLIVSGALFSLFFYAARDASWVVDYETKIKLWVSGGLACLSGYLLVKGFFNRCPSCKSWWGKVELGRTVVDRKTSQRIVTLRTLYKDRQGLQTGHADRQELRLVTIEKHRCYNQCKRCSHQWQSYKTVES